MLASIVLILFYFLEPFLMIMIGLRLFKIKPKYNRILIATVLYAASVWGVRQIYNYFSIPFGTHTIVLCIVFLLIIKILLNLKISQAITVSLFDFILIMLGSSLLMHLYQNIDFSTYNVCSELVKCIVFNFLEDSFVIGAFILLEVSKFNIYKVFGKIEKCD